MRLSQLRMRRWNLDRLPEPSPQVRVATGDDIPALARILTAAFGEEWTEGRARQELIDHPGVPFTFVIDGDSGIAATASYQLQADFPNAGWVHWVGADPAYAGRGFGRAVTLAVLPAARKAGKTEAGLTTDDFRLPAIRTYLGLGFEPDPYDDSHPERWADVMARLETPR